MKINEQILKSWIITIIISPIFLITSIYFDIGFYRTEVKDIFTFYYLFVIIGTLFAVPSLIILILISHFCKNKRHWNNISISLTATALIFSTFLLTNFNYFSDNTIKSVSFPLIYSLIFIIAFYKSNNISTFFQKLKNKR